VIYTAEPFLSAEADYRRERISTDLARVARRNRAQVSPPQHRSRRLHLRARAA
jgi:hypothetical protein